MKTIALEIRQWWKNPLFYAVLLIIGLFVGSQLGEEVLAQSFAWPAPPVPGLETSGPMPAYGWKQEDTEAQRMQAVVEAVYLAAHGNEVLTPALGGMINRMVQPSGAQQKAAQAAFQEMTGEAYDQVSYYEMPPSILAYSEFTLCVERLNQEIGETLFSLNAYAASTPMSYEDALEEYNVLVQEDHVTRAYARLYCDYAGIALGLFPAFLAAFIMGRDKRSGAAQVIGVCPLSGVRYLWSKYLGLVLPLCALLMLVACVPTVGALKMRAQGYNADAVAYLWHAVVWLMPTVLAVCALALFVSEGTGSGIAAVVACFAWWLVSVGRPGLAGPYPFYVSLIRFNSIGAMPAQWAQQIAINRACMVLASAALVTLAGVVYEHKRSRGGAYV